MTHRLLSLSILLALALAACGPAYVYERSYPIPDANWTYAQPLEFSFQIDDTLRIHNLWLEIEHTTDYDFQNLYTRVTTHFPSGKELQEPLSLELADQVGRWNGDCSGSFCTLRILLQKAFFSEPGSYRITLEQFMREDPVKGIRSIGFMLEKTEESR